MKALLLIMSITCLFSQVYASSSAQVLAQHSTTVGFAPEEFQGTYKVQLLDDGTLQAIDNKNNTEVIGKLALETLTKISDTIESLEDVALINPEGPRCTDAPSSAIKVQKKDGTTLVVWRRQGCREHLASDQLSRKIAELVSSLKNVYSTLKQL